MSFEQLTPLEGPDPGQTEETVELQPVHTGNSITETSGPVAWIEANPIETGFFIAVMGAMAVKRLLAFPGLTIVSASESTRQD